MRKAASDRRPHQHLEVDVACDIRRSSATRVTYTRGVLEQSFAAPAIASSSNLEQRPLGAAPMSQLKSTTLGRKMTSRPLQNPHSCSV